MTELKKKYLGEGSHLDPPNIYTMVMPLCVSMFERVCVCVCVCVCLIVCVCVCAHRFVSDLLHCYGFQALCILE